MAIYILLALSNHNNIHPNNNRNANTSFHNANTSPDTTTYPQEQPLWNNTTNEEETSKVQANLRRSIPKRAMHHSIRHLLSQDLLPRPHHNHPSCRNGFEH